VGGKEIRGLDDDAANVWLNFDGDFRVRLGNRKVEEMVSLKRFSPAVNLV
jgi:hypothetical protein